MTQSRCQLNWYIGHTVHISCSMNRNTCGKASLQTKSGRDFDGVLQICGADFDRSCQQDEYKTPEIACWLHLRRAHHLTVSFMVQMQCGLFSHSEPFQSANVVSHARASNKEKHWFTCFSESKLLLTSLHRRGSI